MHVVIVGSGIGGLASAIGFRKAGHDVTVLERDSMVRESGIALGLTPNATRALRTLGVLPHILQNADIPQHATLLASNSLEVIETYHLGDELATIYGSPYIVAHRGDLHAALLAEATRLGTKIKLSHQVVKLDTTSSTISTANGETVSGDLIICADGLNSVSRHTVLGRQVPRSDSGFHIYCLTVPTSHVKDSPRWKHLVDPPCVHLIVGHSGHCVVTSLDKHELLYIYAIGRHPHDAEAAFRSGGVDVSELGKEFSGWLVIDELAAFADGCQYWTLLDPDMPETWVKDRTVLLGDAAHAMLPFVSQGAAMALEDAVVLSRLFPSSSPSSEPEDAIDVEKALATYMQLRYERTAQLKAMARVLGNTYSLPEDLDEAHAGPNDAELSSVQKERVRQQVASNPFANPHVGTLLFGYDAENPAAVSA